jgi:hypothetical protein
LSALPFFSSFTLKGGLIYIEKISIFGGKAADQSEQYFFSGENGDDWFYLEDQTSSENTQCAKKTDSTPFTMSSVSSTETTLIRFKYKKRPEHTVLHKGRCNFAGLKPVDQTSEVDPDLRMARLRVQGM